MGSSSLEVGGKLLTGRSDPTQLSQRDACLGEGAGGFVVVKTQPPRARVVDGGEGEGEGGGLGRVGGQRRWSDGGGKEEVKLQVWGERELSSRKAAAPLQSDLKPGFTWSYCEGYGMQLDVRILSSADILCQVAGMLAAK